MGMDFPSVAVVDSSSLLASKTLSTSSISHTSLTVALDEDKGSNGCAVAVVVDDNDLSFFEFLRMLLVLL